MNPLYVLLLAFLIGVIGGLRTMTAPAVVAWAANRHWLNLDNSTLALIVRLVRSLSLPWVLSWPALSPARLRATRFANAWCARSRFRTSSSLSLKTQSRLVEAS